MQCTATVNIIAGGSPYDSSLCCPTPQREEEASPTKEIDAECMPEGGILPARGQCPYMT